MMAVCTIYSASPPPTSSIHTPEREPCTKTGLHVPEFSTETWRKPLQNQHAEQIFITSIMAMESKHTMMYDQVISERKLSKTIKLKHHISVLIWILCFSPTWTHWNSLQFSVFITEGREETATKARMPSPRIPSEMQISILQTSSSTHEFSFFCCTYHTNTWVLENRCYLAKLKLPNL